LNNLALLLLSWEKGLGDEGLTYPSGSPHPKSLSQYGRGTLNNLAPLRPFWEKGLGDEGLTHPSEIHLLKRCGEISKNLPKFLEKALFTLKLTPFPLLPTSRSFAYIFPNPHNLPYS
jgi:hypothetical protein